MRSGCNYQRNQGSQIGLSGALQQLGLASAWWERPQGDARCVPPKGLPWTGSREACKTVRRHLGVVFAWFKQKYLCFQCFSICFLANTMFLHLISCITPVRFRPVAPLLLLSLSRCTHIFLLYSQCFLEVCCWATVFFFIRVLSLFFTCIEHPTTSLLIL